MSKKLLIIGCGDHGVVAANTALLENKWNEICFLDDKKKDKYKKYKIVGKAKDFKKFIPFWDNYFISIGDNLVRKKFFKTISNKKKIINIIHPSVSIGQNFIMGNGNIILSNSVISDNVNIGDANIINNLCSIDHDCKLKNFIHISPGVNIAGNVNINSETWIGLGSNIINNIVIGKSVTVGAGSLVLKSIKSNKKVFGVPAK